MERNLATELNEIANLYNSTYDYFTLKEIEEQAKAAAEQGKFEIVYPFFDKIFNLEDIKKYFILKGFKVEIEKGEYFDALILNWDLN